MDVAQVNSSSSPASADISSAGAGISPVAIEHARFLAADFSPLAYAQQQLSAHADDNARFAHVLARLQQQLDGLAQQAQSTVQQSQAALLEQIVGVRTLDSALSQAEAHVGEIKAYMHALRARIRVPHTQAAAYARQAGNLQAALGAVRSVARFVQLARRLRVQVDGAQEWAAAAQTLAEIARTPLPAGVALVDRETPGVADRRRRVLAAAEQMVDAGLREHSAGAVAAGLHVLGLLGVLGEHVAARVRRSAAAWAADVAARPLAAAKPWGDVAALADALLAQGLHVRTLERALAVHGRRHAGANEVQRLLGHGALAFWWRAAVSALAARLLAPAVRGTLAAGFPRLARALFPKLEPLALTRLAGRADGEEDPGEAVLWDGLLAPLAAQYVAAASARMHAAVARCLPRPAAAWDAEAAAAAARCIATEVHLAAAHVRLAAAVAGEARGCVGEFVRAAGEFCDAEGVATAGCAAAVSSVAAMRVAVREADARLADAADPAPLLERVYDRARARALAAVADDDLAALEAALQHVLEIAPLHADVQSLADGHRRVLADAVLRAYVHVTLLSFPLSEEVKLQVAGDVARVEFACSQLASLEGPAHQALRMLRPMLFMGAGELAQALQEHGLAGVPTVDLANYVACRVATDAGCSDDEALMPWRLLGCSRQEMRRRLAVDGPPGSDDMLRTQRRSLELLAEHVAQQQQQDTHAELAQLLAAATDRILAAAVAAQ
ncbi:Conserved oligomeric Golgi complex subunit [Coemansia interrupta]|uniref:Conserved oligomeric Golgi complex subunit 5 n=1 Tax=Coemansia interrupta TaxID=1126814 RepID=A0A9W8LM92_9FUNG|nr:Conserved oligomeric Golgi complex subunit [Coemansia interrupta]